MAVKTKRTKTKNKGTGGNGHRHKKQLEDARLTLGQVVREVEKIIKPVEPALHLIGMLKACKEKAAMGAVVTKAVMLSCIDMLLSVPDYINYDLEQQLKEERDILAEQLHGTKEAAPVT